MSYAYITDGTIQTEDGRLPASDRRLDTQQWVLGLPDADVATQQATGWYAVKPTERPADTDTHTHDRSVELIDGFPVETWTPRPWTQAELDSQTAAENRQTLVDRIAVAIDTLLVIVDNLNAITDIPNTTMNANPAAYIKDVAREVKTVARQTIDIARVVSGELDSTDNGS